MTRPLVLSATALAAFAIILPISGFAADSTAQAISLAQESPDQWRASKLVGVPIYGPDNKRVGKITDILMSPDGKAEDVIVGVGGFLGIGEKDVAIPYPAVNFVREPMPMPATGATDNNLAANGNAAQPNATVQTNAATPGLGAPAGRLGNPAAPTTGMDQTGTIGAPQPSTAYPDHGTIAFTTDQIKNAPAFHFAK